MNYRYYLSGLAAWVLTTSAIFGQAIYTQDHGDIGVGYENEGSGFELHPHWHLGPNAIVDGSPVGNAPDGEEYDAGDIIAQVPDDPLARPASTQWDFLGNNAGEDLWILPQTEDPTKPFLGLATEELTLADWTGNISFTLSGFTGPGDFSLYQTDGFGVPTAFFATSDGLSGADEVSLAPGSHSHYNWAFTAQGSYDLELTVSGTHAVDGFQTATETFSFNVVPEPSTGLLLGLGMALAFLRSRSRRASSWQ